MQGGSTAELVTLPSKLREEGGEKDKGIET